MWSEQADRSYFQNTLAGACLPAANAQAMPPESMDTADDYQFAKTGGATQGPDLTRPSTGTSAKGDNHYCAGSIGFYGWFSDLRDLVSGRTL